MESNSQPSIHSPSLATATESNTLNRQQRHLLLGAAAVSSSVGLAAELLLGTLASYLVGNAALSYGVAVGGFLAAMGIGAYLSQFIAAPTTAGSESNEHQQLLPHQWQQLLVAFVQVELLIAPLTALLPLGLFLLFVVNGPLWIGLFLVTIILGVLSGIEVPLLTRLIEQDQDVRHALAGVLALDYLGALLGSLLFPVLLLPTLGLFPTAALIGSFPAFMVWAIGRSFRRMRSWGRWGLVVGVILCLFVPLAVPLSDRLENNLYNAPIITRIQSPYQRIVLTRIGADLRLYLDGDLQLSTLDEYRYHEALVHPAMSVNPQRQRILLLGAGDGMALREVLKWPEVERVLLIDLDAAVVNLARRQPMLARINHYAFADPRVEVRQGDAFTLVPQLSETFDVIVADFPDPDREAIAKLYAKGFYQQLLTHLKPEGVLVTQASSPFFAPRVLDCIAATMSATGLQVYPYTVDVPSFGPWGFVLGKREAPLKAQSLRLPVLTRFLTQEMLPTLFQLPGDLQLGKAEINRLTRPVIIRYQDDPRWEAYH